MTTTLNKLLIAAALSSLAVTACDKARVTAENGGHTVELTQHGNVRCVLVDDKVFCALAKMRASTRLASAAPI